MSPALALAVALQVISCAAAVASPEPVPALILQRSLPLSGTHLERLKEHDRSRLARKGKNGAAAAGFYLDGMPGLYYAHVKLGTPSKEYSLQFDTGSDVLWVSCTPCTGCPTSTELNITLEFYDPNSSSTSSKMLCSDNRCTYALETGAAVCNPSDSRSSQCGYTNTYVDGSATSGYYVSDTLHFDAFMRNEQGVSSSASVFFGCSTSRSGNLHTDGIIGFGKNAISVISQLKTQGMSPKVFSHCLKGSKEGHITV
ncbi:hypothetical protein CFC21_080938 [Triticum aestivum]|uniref:Peptidase A1 domain-containing protein n=2 Tax=Triticum aestivum TaxID=4565 RepID=A0A3B6N3L2_WHEAT|nr:aspartic proteinase 36-like isoform X2 [Triticum aestivum]KAF7076255.1 hypothetical protein CFC21_080938 [Triticum aestivum]